MCRFSVSDPCHLRGTFTILGEIMREIVSGVITSCRVTILTKVNKLMFKKVFFKHVFYFCTEGD